MRLVLTHIYGNKMMQYDYQSLNADRNRVKTYYQVFRRPKDENKNRDIPKEGAIPIDNKQYAAQS